MKALRPQGRVVLMGVSGEPLQVPVSLLFVEGKILGSSQNDPEHLYEALDFVARGKVKVVTDTYSLDEVEKAYDRVEKGEVRFRAVRPSPQSVVSVTETRRIRRNRALKPRPKRSMNRLPTISIRRDKRDAPKEVDKGHRGNVETFFRSNHL
jgi:hypothetical protein